MAAATRELRSAWKTAVALKPPSATSLLHASLDPAITDDVCTEAACTTTSGFISSISRWQRPQQEDRSHA